MTTPYQRIMRAWKRGTGAYLSPEDCAKLSLDDAIETRARQDNFHDQEVKAGRVQRGDYLATDEDTRDISKRPSP